MSILVGKETRLLVQGITGREGGFHTQQMLDYGTNIVAGVTPGKGGEWIYSIPVFDTVIEAVTSTEANTSIICVPAIAAADAAMEVVDAGIDLVVCITEGIPVLDMARLYYFLRQTEAKFIGPSSSGLITPGSAKVGIMPGHIHTPGQVGIVSRSATLSYEVAQALTNLGIGQSTAVGLGSDPIIGSTFVDILRLFEEDPLTEHIVLIGEIGGIDEQIAAAFIAKGMSKPVTAFIAGLTAPPGRRMGHAGAIIHGDESTAERKILALQEAGAKIARLPEEVAELVQNSLG